MTTKLILGDRINLPAFIGGLIFLYVLFEGEAWWIIKGLGENPSFYASVAPYNIDITILGKPVYVPIIEYIVLSGYISMLWVGISTTIASFIPRKKLSSYLLGYKPVLMTFGFLISIYMGVTIAETYVGITIPVMGESTLYMEIDTQYGPINVYTPSKAYFTSSYFIVLIASILIAIGKAIQTKYLKKFEGT